MNGAKRSEATNLLREVEPSIGEGGPARIFRYRFGGARLPSASRPTAAASHPPPCLLKKKPASGASIAVLWPKATTGRVERAIFDLFFSSEGRVLWPKATTHWCEWNEPFPFGFERRERADAIRHEANASERAVLGTCDYFRFKRRERAEA